MKRKSKSAKPQTKRPKVNVDVGKLDQLVDKAELGPLQKEECTEIRSAIHYLATEVARQQHKRKDYRQTEKAKKLLKEFGASLDLEPQPSTEPDGETPQEESKKKRGGNGRLGAAAYVGASVKTSPLAEEFRPKKPCVACCKGKYYRQDPSPILRITGLPPIQGELTLLERTRCNLCGDIRTASVPEGIGEDKYDCSVAAMIALLKYGSGMPFHRIESLQKQLGVPLPASTQFGLVDDAANQLVSVHHELVRQAAQGQVATFDDTRAQILDEVERPEGQDEDRTGIKTTGLIVELDTRKVAIFMTGPRYAAENMSVFLKKRAEGLEPLVGMADASPHNNPEVPEGVALLMSACLTHGRRQFIDVFENFPQECWHVIEQLGVVYYNDKLCRNRNLTKEERLLFHQQQSGPVMEALRDWMESHLSEKNTEPNSGLGKAINYFLKRWDRLTLFLRHPGSPLDSTVVERALKKAILNRKNSFFFKTQHGAEVADLFLTLIHTCELNEVNPFSYLVEVLRHPTEAREAPGEWLPWTYKAQLRAP